ncbi:MULTISPECIES: LacI family DNA-binding transcriptional regulator [unclassified Microbacterium]|uniref:LacI family DNA-binding transcriptional regulator n=1 Tax=unclassified Microbacterium TaxID=2609290 RepID=UPI00301B1257
MPASDAPRGRPTLAELARDLGVSSATVSKVINGRSGVSVEVREHIEETLRSRGYAKPLVNGNNDTIDLVFDELRDPAQLPIIAGAVEAVEQHGLRLSIHRWHDSLSPTSDIVADAVRRKPAGLILVRDRMTASERDGMAARKLNFVSLNPRGSPAGNSYAVYCDNWAGALSAARHLLEAGHRRIGMVTGPENILATDARTGGFDTALREYGIAPDPALVVHGDFSVESGAAGAQHLLALPDPPTAIFTHNDFEALGVYNAAQRAGVSIPDELSVVGFDDMPLSAALYPPLTTVHQPLAGMAARAVDVAVALHKGSDVPHHSVLATRLIVRGSVARPR